MDGQRNGKLERIAVEAHGSSAEAARAVAGEIAELIRGRAREGTRAVLGLATGSTPVGVYEELVRLHRAGLSFANVVTFNLDEYWPMKAAELQSYRRFMDEHLFDHVDVPRGNIHLPEGEVAREGVGAFCAGYERAIREAGGVDLQILGVGRTGHIGFNEPGSARDSRTRLITLDRVTRMDAASDFFGERNVPRHAITMGVGTILEARRIVLLAFGEHKAGIVKRAVEGEISASVAASFLQQHGDTTIHLDPAAAAELTRFKTPWLVESGLTWDVGLTRRAVIWLAMLVGKPILKLTDEDYNERGLSGLLTARGGQGKGRSGAYEINIEVFKALQGTITGWPGGKTGVEAGRKGSEEELHASESRATKETVAHASESRATKEASKEGTKKIVIFSPHPDDDVISMGGTLIRLCEQGHEVHVAYQTSGNIAVWDESALRHADFIREFAHEFPGMGRELVDRVDAAIESFVAHKAPGQVDAPELQKVKTLIRRTEARAAARYSGVKAEHIHFLDLPFYETGRVRKKPVGEEDIRIVAELLDRIEPRQVYAAGDLSDPHGTHRVCLAAILSALERLKDRAWMSECVVWLYRGAWQEWGPHEIEMAVPLSPDEVVRKRMAIFKHESQKDLALFPGPSDPREFWQRAEDRNKGTAKLYDALGLAEYEAIEGFVKWKPGRSS